MKKFVLIVLVLLISVQNVYASTEIDKAIKCLQSIDDTRTLDIIKGKNFTKQAIEIKFIDNYEIPFEYRNMLATTNVEYSTYTILINGRLRNSPPEALACLIAHEATHIRQGMTTKEEEVTAWTYEADTWRKLIKNNHNLINNTDDLSTRENSLVIDLLKSNDGIKQRVYDNSMYASMK